MADNETEIKLSPSSEQTTAWERTMISRLLSAGIDEQRRARRWSIFFKSLFFLYLFLLLIISLPKDWRSDGVSSAGRHTALVDMQGVIADNSAASADTIVSGLRAAFKDKGTVGVILRINSPGGSPVQAGYITDEIQRLRIQYPAIPLYAVITDVCASGGYYVASAADKIYADKASLVGSIGVLMDGFGFTGTMDKLGVERRLLTAGGHKGFLDPFSPVNEEEIKHVHGLLNDIHRQFIDTVKHGRGARLKDSPELFSGLVWTGEQGVGLGLVDGLGSSSYVAREVIKAETIVDYTPRENYLNRLTERFGLTMAKSLSASFGLHANGPTLR